MPLRCAIDWATALYRVWVTGKVWKLLQRVGHRDGRKRMDFVGPDGSRASVSVTAKHNDVIIKGPGGFIKVCSPSSRPVTDDGHTLNHYGIELQVQGEALAASGGSGVDVVRWWRFALENALLRHYGASAAERADAVRELVYPGRFDIAVDIAVQGDEASDWIEKVLFASGNINEAAQQYSTRARVPSGVHTVNKVGRPRKGPTGDGTVSMKGTQGQGRTASVGNVVKKRDYEKDKVRALSSKILLETLKRECAWNGTDRLIRQEIEIKRAWFRDQVVKRPGRNIDGSVCRDPITHEPTWIYERADRLCFDDWLDNITIFACEAFSRFRHTEETPGVRRSSRPNSGFQEATLSALELFKLDALKSTTPWIQHVLSKKRDAAVEMASARAVGAIVRIKAIKRVTFWEAAQLAYREVYLPRKEFFDAMERDVREKFGICAGPELADMPNEDGAIPIAEAG